MYYETATSHRHRKATTSNLPINLHFTDVIGDEIVLTETGTAVTVIHVSNLPKYTSHHNLYQIFQEFGKVTNCYIRYHISKYYPLYAFVTFFSASDAMRAQCSEIEMGSKKLKIAAADSWHQSRVKRNQHSTIKKPNKKFQFAICGKNDVNFNQESENILTMLNEDCLLKILSYIPIHELIRSSRVCKRWHYVVLQKLQSVHVFKTRDWDCYISLNNFVLLKLLENIGKYLRVLHLNQDWSMLNEVTPYIVGRYCPNLVELVVISLDSKFWKGAISKCKKLKRLTFESCSDITDQTFQFCKARLEELIIRDTHNSIGRFFKFMNLQNLKRLTMSCVCIKEKGLLEIFSNLKELRQLSLDETTVSQKFVNNVLKILPNLKELSLSSLSMQQTCLEPIIELKHLEVLRLHMNSGVTDEFIKKLCKGCPSLTVLDVSTKFNSRIVFPCVTNDGLSQIWRLKNLKELNISGLDITDAVFKYFEKGNYVTNLKNLICRHNSNISENSIINLVTNCPSIERIDVFNCFNIRKEFMDNLTDLLRSLQRTKLLELNTSAVGSTEILFSPNESSSHLRITYETFDTLFLFGSSDLSDNFDESDDENYFLDFSIGSISEASEDDYDSG